MQIMSEYGKRVSDLEKKVNSIRAGQKIIWVAILGIAVLVIILLHAVIMGFLS